MTNPTHMCPRCCRWHMGDNAVCDRCKGELEDTYGSDAGAKLEEKYNVTREGSK